jgi:serine phosphatase RsbU (regulator of sigma subunit)
MGKREGSSLSVKMILTTTLLVLVTVAGSAVLNVINVRREIGQAADDSIQEFKESREANGEWATPLFAATMQQAISQRGQDPVIRDIVQSTVGGDTQEVRGQKDYGLRLAMVLDQKRDVVAHCVEDETLRCAEIKDQDHPPIAAALVGEATVGAWKQAGEAWKKAGAKGSALVKFDFPEQDPVYRVFAVPVMLQGLPTPDVAIAETSDARLGFVLLGYDLKPIEAFAAEAAEEKAAASTRAALYSLAVGALFVLIGTVLAILQGLSITRPIKQLAYRADQIARGDLESRVEVTSRDEIGLLGENFNFMADQIAILLEQTAEKARIEQELEVAKAIQETLVPGADPIDRGVLKFAGFYQPAAQTGGDWWTWHELTGGKILVVIGDVTGHGVPSAMITAAAKAACDVARHVHNDDVTVTRLLEIMNHAIWQSAQRRFVMTCFASIVDTKARTITYANAGHNFPYLFRATEGKGEFGSLMIRGNRLGDDPSSKYEAKTTDLVPGDTIVWYTDGIVECENEAGEEYGEKRFRASVRRAGALDAGEMRDAIVGEAVTYFAEMPRKDDITMVVGRIH